MGKVRKVRGSSGPRSVPASELKNSWHEYLDRVDQGNEEIVVTRYGKPVARLVPYIRDETGGGIFGCLTGTVTIRGDIVNGTGEIWEADG